MKTNEDSVQWLRENGYSLIIWHPDELKSADPRKVADRLVELGWQVIEDLQED